MSGRGRGMPWTLAAIVIVPVVRWLQRAKNDPGWLARSVDRDAAEIL